MPTLIVYFTLMLMPPCRRRVLCLCHDAQMFISFDAIRRAELPMW